MTENGDTLYGSPEPIPGKCGSKLRLSDPPRYCRRNPLADRERCDLHGGSTPRGVLSPHYSGRGYTKDMPTRLLERLVEGIDDPELTSLRTEIALLDARMGELLEGLSDTGAAEAWQSVTGLVSSLRQAVENPDMMGREGVLSTVVLGLTAAVATEHDAQQTWKEVYTIIDRRRRTTNVELKREEAAEFTLRHAQAVHFFQVLTAVIQEEVEDPGLRARLGVAVAREMNREPPQRLLEAGDATAE